MSKSNFLFSKLILAFVTLTMLAGCSLFFGLIGAGSAGAGSEVPVFRLPPPEPSAVENLSGEYFEDANLLKHIDSILSAALNGNGYYRKSYYYVTNGFAIVTQLERIYEDAHSYPEPSRWGVEYSSDVLSSFSIEELLRSLFRSNPGYYRCIVFVITPYLYNFTDEEVSNEMAAEWLRSGVQKLPPTIGDKSIPEGCTYTALIYEFMKKENSETVLFIEESRNSGRIHMLNSNILKSLTK